MQTPHQKFNRRDFIRLAGLSLLGLGLEPLLSACSGPETAAVPTNTPANTLTPTYMSSPTPADPTATPTRENTPTPAISAREQRRLALIDRYGTATKALPLEFHGDHYWFYDGAYSMDPRTFVWMMEWFQKNDVWAVSADELIGFSTAPSSSLPAV